MGTFPNYLNEYVLPNRVVILERFRLLRNSVCRVASQSVFYCGTLGKPEIAGLRSDSMRGGGGGGAVGTKMFFFVEISFRLS